MRDKRENYLLVVSKTSPSQTHRGSSQLPLTTTSDGGFFWPKSLSLSLNLTSLPRSNPKVSTFLSTPDSLQPQPLLSLDLGLKRDCRCECLGVWFRMVNCSFFFFFFFFCFANGFELGMLVAVTDEVEGDAQSKCGCWESGALGEREKETQLKWERKREEREFY